MTDVLKELVAAAEKYKVAIETYSGSSRHNMAQAPARLLVESLPALESLLSQEAELENLANRMGTAATVNGHDEHAQEVLRAFRDELRALIRRHHES